MSSKLSTLVDIENAVRFNPGDFKASDKLGSFVINREFSNGLIDYIQNKDTSRAYIWKCLSAIGDDIGETIYLNVKNYIDMASNIETCKVKSLRSLMKMFGFDQTIFDDIEMIPIELMNLINIMSIDKKYMLKDSFLKDAIINDMKECGVISRRCGQKNVSEMTEYEISTDFLSYFDSECSNISSYTSQCDIIDNNKYYDYVYELYSQLLSNFCCLEYNQTPSKEKHHFYIYKTITEQDLGYKTNDVIDIEKDEISKFKVSHNILNTFDQSKIVDDIDNGLDSIDNYQYPYKDLIELEIKRRSEKVTIDQLAGSYTTEDEIGKFDKDGVSIENKTRYSYYRKAKVIEYINFIDNKFFIDTMSELSSSKYTHDYNYYIFNNIKRRTVLDIQHGKLDEEVIKNVAKSLTTLTQYITKLREKLKLQVRKTYMKGTQNLLLYIINEYLNDYASINQNIRKIEQLSAYPEQQKELSIIFEGLKKHQLNDMNIIEYYDDTGYYNQETESSNMAQNGEDVNRKFWSTIDMTNDNGQSFSLAKIQNFYQNVMSMRDVIKTDEELSSFLDTIFDFGADTSFIDKNTGLFTCKLSKYNGKYTNEIFDRFVLLSSEYKQYNEYLKDKDFKYNDSDVISNQISTAVEYIRDYTTEEKLYSISSVQEYYEPIVEDIEISVSNLRQKYIDLISGDNNFYFISSDCKYCHITDENGQLIYKHDYLIDNPNYPNDYGYILYDIQNLGTFINNKYEGEKNIVNYPMIDTIFGLSSAIIEISSKYITEVVDRLSEIGFYDIQSPDLDEEMDYGQQYIENRLQRRLNFLTNQLEQIRTEANQLNSTYQSVKENFAQIISQYDDGSSEIDMGATTIYAVSNKGIPWQLPYYEHVKGTAEDRIGLKGFCRVSKTGSLGAELEFIQYNVSLNQFAYRRTTDYSELEDVEYQVGTNGYMSTPVTGYNDSDPLETRIQAFIEYQDAPTAFDYTKYQIENAEGTKITVYETTEGQIYYGLKKEGSYAAAVQCNENIQTMKAQVNSLETQINLIGGDITTTGTLEERILKLVEYISTEFSEGNFENDSIVKECRYHTVKITQLKQEYKPYKKDYEELRTDPNQSLYLNDCDMEGILTLEELNKMYTYSVIKDDSNRVLMNEKQQSLITEYNLIYAGYTTTAIELQNLEYTFYNPKTTYSAYVDDSSGIIEVGIESIRKFLKNDTEVKINDITYYEVPRIIDIVKGHLEKIEEEIKSTLNTKVNFDTAVNNQLDYLTFTDDEQYQIKNSVFMTYGGIDMCYYPYYNLQNITHPSYQIHPFLWNIIAKNEANITNFTKVYDTIKVDDLIGSNISKTIDRYFGEYGQSINKWMNSDILDYTGYTTRYETSDHKSDNKLQQFSEVIDYDGAFYQPAIDYLNNTKKLRGSIDTCISSIIDAISFDNQWKTQRKLEVDKQHISNFIKIKENYDDQNQVSSYTYQNDISTYQWLSPSIEPYVVCDIKPIIEKYYKENLSNTVDISISFDKLLTHIVNNIPQTFYGKYYQHNNLINKQKARLYIAEQLCVYFDDMLSTVLGYHPKSNCYDIYKYGMDRLENTYTLFKKYDIDSSYQDKKNTTGDIWIRIKDHPIAFPAFTGKRPNVKLSKFSDIPQSIIYLEDIKEDTYEYILSAQDFYDFQFSKDGNNLYLISKNISNQYKKLSDDIQGYENSQIINCPIRYVEDTEEPIQLNFKFNDLEELKYTQCIRSGYGPEIFSHLSVNPIETSSNIDNYAFIGSFITKNFTVDFVYAKKNYLSSGNVTIEDNIKIIELIGGLHRSHYDLTGNSIIEKPYGDQLICAYDNSQFTFAYLQELDKNNNFKTSYGTHVDKNQNSQGSIISNPKDSEMNSHDLFNHDVRIVKCNVSQNKITPTKKTGQSIQSLNDRFNLNSDMSFIPSYPGLSGEIHKNITEYKKFDTLNFQLMGSSKNIDNNIECVNKDVDPYFNFDNISSNFLFGRVYEDYIEFIGKDNSFRAFTNKSINNRTHPTVTKGDETFMSVEIDISGYNYTNRQLEKTNILLYNKNTLGKNPYLMTNLLNIADSSKWYKIENYNDNIEELNSREQKLSTSIDSNISKVTATGIFSYNNSSNSLDSNYIKNIKDIYIRYDRDLKKIFIKFIIDDIEKIYKTFVAQDSLQLILYNKNDLTIFNYFHFLDAYGLINVHDGTLDFPRDKIGDGWKFIYDRKTIADKLDLVDGLRSYVYDEKNNKRLYNDKIKFEEYDYLSDVYALKGEFGVGFKYSDEDKFDLFSDNYYFPTLNIKFPKNAGEYVNSNTCNFEKMSKINTLSSVFGQNNLYLFNLIDNSINSNIGNIKMDIDYDSENSIQMFEKFTVFEDGSTISNTIEDYDINDIRVLSCIEFCEKYTDNNTSVSKKWINSQIIRAEQENIYTEDFLSDIYETVKMYIINHEKSMVDMKTTVSFDIFDDISSDMMNIYANYKKTDDGIVLYFNYFNYLNTPFIKIENQKIYPDYIDGTYLELSPGEEGYLNIVIQLKNYVNGKVYGVKNIKMLQYKIINLSDDKPKFSIKEVYRLQKSDSMDTDKTPHVTITTENSKFEISSDRKDYYPTTHLNIYVKTDRQLKTPYTIGLYYPPELLTPNEELHYGYSISDYTKGYMLITVTDTNVTDIKINITSNIDEYTLQNNIGKKYRLYTDNQEIYGTQTFAGNKIIAEVTHKDGSISINKKQ